MSNQTLNWFGLIEVSRVYCVCWWGSSFNLIRTCSTQTHKHLHALVSRAAALCSLQEQNGSERRRQAEDDHLLGHNISSLSKAVLVTSQDAGPLETKACKCLCVCVEQVLIRLNELPHQHTQYTRLTSIKPNQFSVWHRSGFKMCTQLTNDSPSPSSFW
jgi:hypothetical protein